jgi:hypothetical protein
LEKRKLGAGGASGALRGLTRALARLAQSWWSADRVRASQREGRILRLRPPTVILLDQRQIEVVRRSVAHGTNGAEVIYDCQTDCGPAQMRVAVVGPICSPCITWIENDRRQLLTEDEFEIWGA